VERLEHDADAVAPQVGQRVGVHAAQLGAVDGHASTGWALQAREQQQQGGLARTGWPGDGHALARRHAEIDRAQHVDACGAQLVMHGEV